MLTGALVGGHWILFFASIKLSTVPVTLVCLSSITLFTAIFEPIDQQKTHLKNGNNCRYFNYTGIVLILNLKRNTLRVL
jgi:hypothetical protein